MCVSCVSFQKLLILCGYKIQKKYIFMYIIKSYTYVNLLNFKKFLPCIISCIYMYHLFGVINKIKWSSSANVTCRTSMKMHILPFVVSFMPYPCFLWLVCVRMTKSINKNNYKNNNIDYYKRRSINLLITNKNSVMGVLFSLFAPIQLKILQVLGSVIIPFVSTTFGYRNI